MIKYLITGGSGFIGTNLIETLCARSDVSILNIDIAAPKIDAHSQYWKRLDIRNSEGMVAAFHEFRPDFVIHLAARTDLDGVTLEDYSSNTKGTQVLVDILKGSGRPVPAIFTSSMYVCRPGHVPSGPDDYQPHTVYGESKVVGEQIVKKSDLESPWVIVRPTSIWGPWFGVPYVDFFKVVLRKRFLHVAGVQTRKTYGYVGNTVAQLLALLGSIEDMKRSVVYLGDWPGYVINEWADEIVTYVNYRNPTVPRALMIGLAKVGDFLALAGIKFPMTSFRLSNMTTDNVHDLSLVSAVMPELPFSRQMGNDITLNWMKEHGLFR